MEMDLKMHFEITNSQRFHQDCCCCSNISVCEPNFQRFLTVVLESSIVIVEGVTLALIDKGEEEKILPEAMLSSL